jgi:hypothetical protein
MTARGLTAGSVPVRLRGVPSEAFVVTGILAGALVVGLLAAARPTLAVGLVVAVVATLAIASDARMLPPFLVLAVFAEGVSVGGFNLGRVIGPVALAVVIYYVLAGGTAHLRMSPLVGAAVAFGAWILVSLYWAVDSHWVTVWFLKWALSVAFAIAFAVLVQREEDVARVCGAFVLGAGVFGLIGVLTYIGSGTRGAGLVGDPNQFASYEALALPPALALACSRRYSAWRPLLYLAIPAAVISIVASFSRGGFLTLAVVVIATLALSWRFFFRRRTDKAAYIGLLAVAGTLVILIGSTAYQQRLGTILSGSDRGSGRTDLWSAAWRGYTSHPFSGLGAGGFEARSLPLLQTTPGVDISASYVAPGRPVHNAYFEPLVDLGPVGAGLFLLLIVLTLVYFVRAARRFKAAGREALWRMTGALAVSYVGLCMALVFLSIELGHMLWAFIGLAVALEALARREGSLPAPSET